MKTRAADRVSSLHPIRAVGLLSLALAAVFLLASCGGEEEQAPAENTSGGQPAASLTDIATNPEEFYGQSVTVDGAVARIINPTTFIITPQEEIDEETQEGDNELFEDPEALAEVGVLVTTQGGGTPNLTERQTVQVSGTVQEINDEFAQQNEVPVNNEYYGAFGAQGGAAIVADSVQQMQGGTTSQGTTSQ